MARPGRKKRTALFIVEIICLLLFIGGLYVYGQIDSRLNKIETPQLDESKIVTNVTAPQMSGYTTYALFGIDQRSKNTALDAQNSDTIIIASINNDTKEVKLASVYRDTLLDIGNDTYTKANAAYAYGGPEQAISMLNTMLDLKITDYVTVNFNAMVAAIDALGGLDIPLSYAEMVFMNDYCIETSQETGKSYTPVELPDPKPENEEEILGTYHLNGVQSVSYCRIRYTASLDMGRTERQRRVIQMIVSKAKSAGLGKIFKIMDDVFPMVTTSMTKDEILQLLPTLIGYSVDDTTGFPTSYKFSNVKGSIIVPTTLETNVIELHKFLYGDEAYTPSATVKANSEKILEIVGGESSLDDKQATVEENTTNDTVIFEKNGSGWSDTSSDYGSDSDSSGGGDYSGDETDNSGGSSSGGGDYSNDGSDNSGGDSSGGEDYEGPTTPEPDYGGDDNGGGDTGGDESGGGDTGGDESGGGDIVDEGSGDDSGAAAEATGTPDAA